MYVYINIYIYLQIVMETVERSGGFGESNPGLLRSSLTPLNFPFRS